MEKYELREGEEFIEEYIDNEGNHVTIFEDKNGQRMVGLVLDMDEETMKILHRDAARAGMNIDDFVAMIVNEGLKRMIEEKEMRQAIEEISD